MQNTSHTSLLKRVTAAWKRLGGRTFIKKAFKELLRSVWEKAQIIELEQPLDGRNVRLPKSRHPIEIKLLEPSELSLLRPVTTHRQFKALEEYVEHGYTCYTARVNGEIAAHNWYTPNPRPNRISKIQIHLKEKEIFLAYTYTVRKWRGRALDPALKAFAFQEYYRKGFRGLRTDVDITNRVSFRMMFRWGAKPCRLYDYKRFLGWRITGTKTLEPTRELMEKLAGPLPRTYQPDTFSRGSNAQEGSSEGDEVGTGSGADPSK